MIQVKKYEIQQTVIMLLSLTVILLADLVRAQQAAPYQYGPQPYQNAFNYDRRRVNVPYGSFGGDSIKFPGESSFAPSSSALNSRVHGTNEQYNFNARNKKDMIQNDGTHYDSHVHRSNEVSGHNMQPFHFIVFGVFYRILKPDCMRDLKERDKKRKNKTR